MQSKVTIAYCGLAAVLPVLFVAGVLLNHSANEIDTKYWIGTPLPPCFVNHGLCAHHLLGTDEVGRDLLRRLIVGANVSTGVSLISVLVTVLIGILAGIFARRSAPLRTAIVSFAEALSCFPAWPLILLMAGMAFSPRGDGLAPLVLASFTALFFSPPIIKRVAGSDGTPPGVDLTGIALRQWAFIFLALATVDFFGFGIQPPTASLGNMLVNVISNFQIAWWAAVFPAVLIVIIAAAISVTTHVFFRTSFDYSP